MDGENLRKELGYAVNRIDVADALGAETMYHDKAATLRC